MRIILIVFSLMVIITCCKKQNVNESLPDQKLWIAHLYSGGIKCETSRYHPPDIKLVLNDAGINVYDVRIEEYDLCAACGCLQYAAMHYALIDSINFSLAERLGFLKRVPPSSIK